MIRVLLFLTFFVGATLSYDFKDPYFNDFLLEDLMVLQGRPALKKASDSEESQLQYTCCDYLNEENFSKLQQTQIVCYVENSLLSATKTKSGRAVSPVDMFSCDRLDKLKQQYICASDCVARKENITDDSGNLLGSEVLVPFVSQYYAPEVFQDEQIKEFVDTCLGESKTDETVANKCNPSSARFGYCMWRKTILSCPNERQDTSPACDNLRDKLLYQEAKYLSDETR
ncbi:AAEL006105-PA [Aedes aegypti]|uniref:AAEL006105-PA n=2 Tax=Aedes aegypti TaxID=7159 RepID=A0A1S4FCI7_AEDAE|nr:uncharacterized protein LOC5567450 [Aedes aegypti]EAT42363.1 AAEL006105-PA [Aedes aegypti]